MSELRPSKEIELLSQSGGVNGEVCEVIDQYIYALESQLNTAQFEKDKAYRARDSLARQNENLEGTNKELRCRTFVAFTGEECLPWIPENQDLENIICPIVIHPKELKGYLDSLNTANERIKEYQRSINEIDDYFEYSNESLNDRRKVHNVLKSLTERIAKPKQ